MADNDDEAEAKAEAPDGTITKAELDSRPFRGPVIKLGAASATAGIIAATITTARPARVEVAAAAEQEHLMVTVSGVP